MSAAAMLAAGCGGASRHSRTGTTVVMLMASAPNSLDPAVGDNPEALEADWLLYTPLLTYARVGGVSGTRVLAGLAETAPTITDDGLLYTFVLRPGLRYSNGQPVRASDFAWAVERAIKLSRYAKQITRRVIGAGAFAAGRARTISGISADDASGQITIRLTAPDGTFENLLALPALAPVPAGTPFTDQQSSPPAGVGPYRLAGVVPGRSFSLLRNPGWANVGVQYAPPAHLDIDVRITGDAAANARAVLDNTADVFDWPDPIAPSTLSVIRRSAPNRYFARAMQRTYLVFLNAALKPFSSQLAREAVRAALDQTAMSKLAPGSLLPGCYLLLPSMFGHPRDACPDGNKTGAGNLAAAQALVRRSGMGGTAVEVWTEASSPAREWMGHYASLLRQIGFNATLHVVPDGRYQTEIGAARMGAQTGYGELDERIPNPADSFAQLTGIPLGSGAGVNGRPVQDQHLDSTVRALTAIPATTLGAVANYWRELELYVAEKAYVAVLGYAAFTEFVSDRIDFRALVFSPVAGYDLSSLRLK